MTSTPPSPPDLAAAMDEVRRAHRHLIVASDRLMAMLRVVVQKPSLPLPLDKQEPND